MPKPDPVEALLDSARGKSNFDLRVMPPGFLRCLAVYQCNSSICNSGFEECFYHEDRYPFLIPCVEYFDRIGNSRMVEIFKSVIVCLLERNGHSGLAPFVPDGYTEGFKPLSNDLSRLDFLYYDELENLPQADRNEDAGVRNSIGYYLAKFPEDFRLE